MARYAHTRNAAERDELVRRYMPLARSAAARYQHTSESFDDLMQVAAIGLLKAIDRYDPGRGQCVHVVCRADDLWGAAPPPARPHLVDPRTRRAAGLGQRLRSASDELSAELGRPPTVGELAAHLDVSEEAVLDARQAIAAHSPASLDAPASESEDAASLGELLGADDSALARAEDAIVLERCLAGLRWRSRLRLRFQEDLRQREIGARLGVSQMQVSRLIRQSLEQLRVLEPNADDSGSGS